MNYGTYYIHLSIDVYYYMLYFVVFIKQDLSNYSLLMLL